MNTYNIYIGSNNLTHKLEKEKIEQIVAASFEGFTLQEAVGYWKGTKEKSAIVTLQAQSVPSALIEQLKAALKQEAIAYQEAPLLMFA